MKKKIFHNWGLKLASLILAAVIWFLVAKIGDPTDTVTFYNVPVKLINTELLDKENKVYEILDKTDSVRVTVKAPKSVTSKLRQTDIIAEADMAKLTDISTIEISYSVPMIVEEVTGDHDVIRLSVEDRATKWVRVQYQTNGEAADGFIVAGASLDQNRIEVTGPKSVVEKINYASIGVDVSGATSNVSINVEPEYIDTHGEPMALSNVTQSVERVHVEVEILATKEVPVVLNTMGVPAEGYAATGRIESSMDSILIAGKQSVIHSVTKIVIPADELNLTGENSNMVNIINIKDYLPENIRFADSGFNGRITVTVFIEELVDRKIQIPLNTLSIRGVPEGYWAEFMELEEGLSITVRGLTDIVNGVNTINLDGNVNISEWMADKGIEELRAGIYDIGLKFSLPEGVTTKDTLSIKVNVHKTEGN